MAESRHVALLIRSDRYLDRSVARGVGDYMRDNEDWNLYVDTGNIRSASDFQRWHADGIIAEFNTTWPVQVAKEFAVPLVGFGVPLRGEETLPYPVVMSDHVAIGEMAAEHLINQGLRRFAYCGSHRVRDFYWSNLRRTGFERRLAEASFACDTYRATVGPSRDWSRRQEELSQWVKSLDKPVGILAYYDGRGRELLEACRFEGLRVPEQVAIIGVDNDEFMCDLATPSLSSVETGCRHFGYQAAALLEQLMSGQTVANEPRLVAPDAVIARGSTDVLGFGDAEVAEAVRFIRQHACEPISVNEVLEQTGMSTSKAHRKFKAALGRSVHEEIQRVQMDRVKTLLGGTNQSIKQIAYAAGFDNTKYLSKLFHKLVGLTPTEFRRLHSSPVLRAAAPLRKVADISR